MSKATPGPWVAQGKEGFEIMGPEFVIARVQCGFVARVEVREALETAQADARLIAAAPELLAALTELYQLGQQESIGDGELEAAQLAARKAMLKARGGA